MKKLMFMAALCGFTAVSGSVQAQDENPLEYPAPAYLSFGVGSYDVTQGDDRAIDFRVEYRHDEALFWKIKPWGGVEATTDGSVWGGVGILADLKLAQNIYMTPSFGAGLYGKGSSHKNLDNTLEFRSTIEAGYEFDNTHRLGVAFGHISNAGLGDDNPGTEILNVYYHIPVDSLYSD